MRILNEELHWSAYISLSSTSEVLEIFFSDSEFLIQSNDTLTFYRGGNVLSRYWKGFSYPFSTFSFESINSRFPKTVFLLRYHCYRSILIARQQLFHFGQNAIQRVLSEIFFFFSVKCQFSKNSSVLLFPDIGRRYDVCLSKQDDSPGRKVFLGK